VRAGLLCCGTDEGFAGGLIHAAVGSYGAFGECPLKRIGCAAYPASSVTAIGMLILFACRTFLSQKDDCGMRSLTDQSATLLTSLWKCRSEPHVPAWGEHRLPTI
jgi:hypothetical protein